MEVSGTLLKFDEQRNVWNETYIVQQILSPEEKVIDAVMDCSKMFVAILHSAHKTNFLKFDEFNENVSLVNVGNVFSLRDICFIKLFNAHNLCFNLAEKEILQNTVFAGLPQSLKRLYFGPEYSHEKNFFR